MPIPPPAPASQVVITSPAIDITEGNEGPMTVELEDSTGNPATSTSSQTISLSTSSSTGAFYLTQTSTSPITSVVIPAGQSSASFYYSDNSAGSPTVTASDLALGSAPSQRETINPLSASQVVITSPALDITAGSRGQVTVQLEDPNGVPAVSTSLQTIHLGTTSAAGTFFASSTSTTPITSVVIPIGQSDASFYYDDTKAGAWTLTASDTALVSTPTQQARVSPAAAKRLVFHTQPSSTATAGVAFTTQPVIYEEDPYGNLETGDNHTVVSASLATGTGPLLGTTMATLSGGIATFTHLADNKAETISLKFVSGQLNTISHPIVVTAAPATQLVVTTQPPNPINPEQGFALVVQAEDRFNNVDTNYNGSVSISLAGDPSFAKTVQAKDGVAIFASLTASASSLGLAIQVAAPDLSGTTTNPLSVNAAPMVMLEKVVVIRKKNKKGKPVLAGFTLEFGVPLDSATASNPANYQVDTVTTKKVKKKVKHILHPITNLTVTNTAASDAVTIAFTGKETFPTGGQITVLSGVTGAEGGAGGNHGVYDLQGWPQRHTFMIAIPDDDRS